MERQSIREFIQNYKQGMYKNQDFDTQCKAGWYDWFCKERYLAGKTKKLADKLIQILHNDIYRKIDIDNMYVFFKNNCPLHGPLYDSMSICDIETGEVMFWITPKSGHTGKAELAARIGGELNTEVEGSWKDVLAWFNK